MVYYIWQNFQVKLSQTAPQPAIQAFPQGKIIVGGNVVTQFKPRHVPAFRRNIGIILQTPHLLPDRSVLDNTALPLIVAGAHYRDIQNRARAVLAKMGLQNKQKYFQLNF